MVCVCVFCFLFFLSQRIELILLGGGGPGWRGFTPVILALPPLFLLPVLPSDSPWTSPPAAASTAAAAAAAATLLRTGSAVSTVCHRFHHHHLPPPPPPAAPLRLPFPTPSFTLDDPNN